MTDQPKPPETPGMAEVSPKFVGEAEAATTEEVAAHDLMLVLRAERQGLTAELAATPEGEDAALWPRLEDVEKRILTAKPQTLLGALAQLEVLASMADEGVPDFAEEIIAGMNKEIPARIEGLTAGLVEDPVLVLKREWEARWQRFESETSESDEVMEPLNDRMNETAYEIFQTPATTLAGVAFKLVLWAHQHIGHDASGAGWSKPPVESFPQDLDHLPVVSALHDLERMARTTTVAETPPAKDAALFDALAEYDRLVAISQGLEHRTKVFRPGIPEAKEADKAYETASDESMAAWERVRNTPATTEAGLIARLQATDRFMTELGETDLYDTDWRIIKADVQRITGEA